MGAGVPGGPWIMVKLRPKAATTAALCEGFMSTSSPSSAGSCKAWRVFSVFSLIFGLQAGAGSANRFSRSMGDRSTESSGS